MLMQEKKLLRDALQAILDYIESHKIDVMDSYGNLLEVADMADKALSSTTEETEMEKLVAWLKEKREHYAKMSRDYLDGKLQTGFTYGEREEAVKQVLEYITAQFGEEEEDADSQPTKKC